MRLAFRFDALLVGEELELVENARLELDEEGFVQSISRGSGGIPVRGVGVPCLVNAHVHTGDYSLAGLGLSSSIEEVVGPGGVKHRELGSMSPGRLVESIRSSLLHMASSGVAAAGDFREGGVGGVRAARKAASSTGFRLVVLGRPTGPEDVGGVLKEADGVGFSSPLEVGRETLREAFIEAKRMSKLVASHVAETRRLREEGDLEALLELGQPDFLVHGTHLSGDDLSLLAEKKIPLVVCPRSNMFFGVGEPPVAEAVKSGVLVALGTDNSGWVSPDMQREMEALLALLRRQDRRLADPRLVLRAATINGSRVLSLGWGPIAEGERACVTVLERDSSILASRDVVAAIVLRGARAKAVIAGGELAWL